jgi:transcriptional regulator
MYVQELFTERRPEALQAFIAEYPLGAMITQQLSGVEIDHLPMVFRPVEGTQGVLQCHVASGNPLIAGVEANAGVVAVFQSPNAYISPSWMPGRKRHGKVAPSWNYAAVHVYGQARVIRDESWLKVQLKALSAPQEAHRDEPWTLDEPPADFTTQLLQYIVGVEITIERIVGKRFVGQQRSPSDRAGVVEGLRAENTDATRAIAAMMEAYAPVKDSQSSS